MHRDPEQPMRGFRPLAWLALSALSLAVASCRTERDVQRDIARDLLTPAPLAPASSAGPAAPVRPLPVRVYVDQGYRTEVLHWRSSIESQFERANQVLESEFGIRLAVAEIRPWTRSAPSRDLAGALQELAATDEGAGVEWVIGFLPASTPVVPGSLETLGMGRFFGKQLVVRGMVMAEDRQGIERTLRALSEEERERVMVDRRLHRETVVLLHEWAHTLGAFHDRDNDSIMCPRYDRSAFRFSEAQLRILRLSLSRRQSAEPGARADWARAYRAELERDRADAWDEGTVSDALSSASRLESSREPSPRTEPGSPVARTAAADLAAPRAGAAPRTGDLALLAQADLADRLGDPTRAWKLAAPVTARAEEAPYLRTWACYLQRRAGERIDGRCRSTPAVSLAVGAVLFARVLVECGDRPGALAAAARAEKAFAEAPRPAPPVAWAELSDLLAGMGACTAAERNAARAGGQELAQRSVVTCSRTRGRALLPRGAPGVEQDREPAYVEAVLAGRASLDGGRVEDALSAAGALELSYPGAAGGPWLRCAASARTRNGAATAEACRAAERAAPWAVEPVALLGVALGNQGRWSEARDALRRALERDPLDLESWARLGVALEKLGDGAGLEELRRRYREKFGMTLAPEW